ncbi:MAG TPA: transglycosylase domain-containing protein [Solirubrobacteraceae bacterium]|nr:transglycosylase domain-containing protein [Solirubrobacteraceae bacterium]
MHARQRRRKRNRAGAPDALRALLLGSAIALIAAIAFGGAYVDAVWSSITPLADRHPLLLGTPSEVFAADGERLGFIQSTALRTPVAWSQIPAALKNATVAIEDQRFYHNNGVDPTSIARAAVADITRGEALQGASTITMQLVRNLYLGNDLKTIKQKLAEAKLAIEYNKAHGKREILTSYLNDVTYGTVGGQSALGVQAASRIFFNRPVWQIDLAQAALLAGLPQAPSSYNPFLHPSAARARRNEVLAKMAELHYISPLQAKVAEREPLGLEHGYYYANLLEGFFFEYVRQELIERYGATTVEDGGLKVYTTLNLSFQRQAREAIQSILPESGDPAAAIVSVEPGSGYIRAMTESPAYERSQFNLAADAHRQAGSTFKAFVLLTALKQGVNPYTTYYPSKPLHFVDPRWGPINIESYSGTLGASYNIATALMQSNDPIFTLFDIDLGPPNVKRTAEEAGITAPLLGNPAEALGGLKVGVSPLEMADAYATIASGGYRARPVAITKVVFPDGRVENLGKQHPQKVFSNGVTGEATKLLQRYITAGLGTRAYYGCPYAGGKTGTSNNNVDAWFVGFTAHLSSAVWIGYPQGRVPMTDVGGLTVEGPNLPAELWHDYMAKATEGACTPFPPITEPVEFKPFFGQYMSSPTNATEVPVVPSTATSTPHAQAQSPGGARSPGGGEGQAGAQAPGQLGGGGQQPEGAGGGEGPGEGATPPEARAPSEAGQGASPPERGPGAGGGH